MLIEHMSEGYSFDSFGARININQDTIYEWSKKNGRYEKKEFSEAKKIAMQKSRFVWEKLGIDACNGLIKGFSAATYIFTMKNRFYWSDTPIPPSDSLPDGFGFTDMGDSEEPDDDVE